MVEGWLTLGEAAARLGVTDSALRQAIKRGRLAAHKAGPRIWLVSVEAVNEYAASKWQDGPRNAEWWAARRALAATERASGAEGDAETGQKE